MSIGKSYKLSFPLMTAQIIDGYREGLSKA